MSRDLSAFLAQNVKRVENVLFPATNRIVDEKGNPIPWEICCITATENAKIRKSCMSTVPVVGKRGQYTQEFNPQLYLAKVCVRTTVFPNLQDTELQDSYGVMSAEELITTMLTPGEFEDYSTKVMQVNGFDNDKDLVDEAKN
jgi:xkdN-like protein|nr:MAG TPA: tail assembly chaperone protein [Caudoviricetes sp.]